MPTFEQNAPDPLHRTMQFVLPPLTPHPADARPRPRRTPAPRLPLALAALAVAALGVSAFAWHLRAVPAAASPVGVWETTLRGKASANARLEFAFEAGGAGRFAWRESGPAARSGQTPLRWRLNADKTLALALTAPAGGGDSVSQTLTGIFSGHSWPWRVDRSPHQLVLGTLVFTEKK